MAKDLVRILEDSPVSFAYDRREEITVPIAPLIPLEWAHYLNRKAAEEIAREKGYNALNFHGGSAGGRFLGRGEMWYTAYRLTPTYIKVISGIVP